MIIHIHMSIHVSIHSESLYLPSYIHSFRKSVFAFFVAENTKKIMYLNSWSLIKNFTFIINVVYKNYMYLILQRYYNGLQVLK